MKIRIFYNKNGEIRGVRVKVRSKIIVSGEHAVLYNQTAITCTINCYQTVYIGLTNASKNSIINPQSNYKNPLLTYAIKQLMEYFNITPSPGQQNIKYIKVKGNKLLKVGGMGSSASLIVGLAKAFSIAFNKGKSLNPIEDEELIKLATRIEDFQHGKSSGIDVCAVVKQGVILHRQHSQEIINTNFNRVVLINTGFAGIPTKRVVEYSKSKCLLLSQKFQNCTIATATALQNNEDVTNHIYNNHQLLCKLGVVTKSITNLIEEAYTKYKIGLKVCGAGAAPESISGCGIVATICNAKQTNRILQNLKPLCKKYNLSPPKCFKIYK